ncbi:MAG: hypothetical protein EBX36_01440, partial [Planctomycetia bacterium]|nr:hypothetical protein [Planctomycetia bacterium]
MTAAVLAVVAWLPCGVAMAAPIGNSTWTGGGGSGSWNDASNWSSQPQTAGVWNLVFGGTTQTTNANDIGTISVDTLSFTNDGSAGRTASFTLSGSTLALANSTIVTSATTSGSLSGDDVGNRLTLTGPNVVSLGAGHALTLSGGISGSGSLSLTGVANLFLSGSNSYTGGTVVSGGQVRTAANGPLD